MFERLHTPDEAFRWQLGSALKMEREILEMLDELIEEAHGEELKQTLRSHQAETRGHVTNVEEAFRALGCDVEDSPCAVIQAIDKEGKSNIKKSDESLVDSIILSGAAQTEHLEIAVYEALIVHANAMGHENVVQLLRRNLQEEQAALEKVKTLAEQHAASPASQPA
jgi:ferritin-like metal-binding protein YciE